MCLRRAEPGTRVLGESRTPSPAETQSKEQTGTLSASQRLRGQIAPLLLPTAVTQELYDAITKAISRRGAETQSNEQTATLSASQRLRGQIAPSRLPGCGDAGTLWGNSEGHLAQRRRDAEQRTNGNSLCASASLRENRPIAASQCGGIGSLRRNSEGHLPQRRRDAEKRTNGNSLCASASLRANRPHRGPPVAVT